MKKIDLHIHTVKTNSDADFEFNMESLAEYVKTKSIDVIAITNHNLFNKSQFQKICDALPDTEVFPGIEINIGRYSSGHLLLIASRGNISDFESKCKEVQDKITDPQKFITLGELKQIFGDLSEYLLIPHISKKPHMDHALIDELNDYICCGEVASIKDFIYHAKSVSELTPVIFSDFRAKKVSNDNYPVRQTYIDIGDTSLNAIKAALADKNKVKLSDREGNKIVQILDYLEISTGLNVIIGERASGKTFTVDAIEKRVDNVKYIKQFELLERDPEKAAREFEESLTNKKSDIASKYLKPFSDVVDEIVDISIKDDEKSVELYLQSLKKYAFESERADVYSKCKMFMEDKYQISKGDRTDEVIKAVLTLLENVEHQQIINKHIKRENLISLLLELIEKHRENMLEIKKKELCNEIIDATKQKLKRKSASQSIPELNLYDLVINKAKVHKFEEIVNKLKQPCAITTQNIEDFVFEVKREKFDGAGELKNHSKTNEKFSPAFSKYNLPYEYLQKIKEINGVPRSSYHEYFVNIKYSILNNYGKPVSGGERAEFLLLQKINEASNYDMLIIDEPESSFDNLFLKNKVNKIIKDISENMPVIFVTHNSTVGASIKPDFLIHTKRFITDEKEAIYKVYYGHPNDKELHTIHGEVINNANVTMDCLEAGEDAYNERRSNYDLLKN